jgi:hypothetical protein
VLSDVNVGDAGNKWIRNGRGVENSQSIAVTIWRRWGSELED